jgi:hypothetical protein
LSDNNNAGFTIDPAALRRGIDNGARPAADHFADTATHLGYGADYQLPALVGPNLGAEFANLWTQAYNHVLAGRIEMVKRFHEFVVALEHVYDVYTGTEERNHELISNIGRN